MIFKSYEIKKNLKNLSKYSLLLLYGENSGLKKDIKNIIQFEIKKKEPNTELLKFYEDDIIGKEENFYNSLYSESLFSSKKIIFVNDASDKLSKIIEDILSKNLENTVLILSSNILEKKSKLRILFEKEKNTACIPCYLDNIRDLEIIANTELKKNNISLSKEAVNLLIENSNEDRENLRNEIEKIKSYTLNKKSIGIDELKLIINFSGEYKSEKLINECLSGNILQFKKILSELYSGALNQIFLLRILSTKIQKLLNMKEIEKNYKNIDTLVNEIKPAIFWKDKPIIKKQLLIWSLKDLKKIIYEINNVEMLCKKNPQLSQSVAFTFFSKICKKANSYS
ncbi:MAG: DNA polymerase III subunit delta [Rhodobiaceae bacterium]|nr:DNA polymerase III subunit delta [Rhodobiaceae bacterium]|tara:strand:+ start:2285 stop:3304 length:1020 start_codon:yes stop_codon:yes gene_type:complete